VARFKKGEPRPSNAVRRKGTPNKLTKGLKEAIISALERAGGEDWLVALAKSDKRTFASLLGRVLPTEITDADVKALGHGHTVTVRYVDPKPPLG
jgi:hypothetical protein